MPIDPEAIALGTGFAPVFARVARAQDRSSTDPEPVGQGNVLAMGARRAYDSLSFDDLDSLEPHVRADAIRANGSRYEKDADGAIEDSLAQHRETMRDVQAAADARLPDLVAEPVHAQRQFASDALHGLDRAENALADAGHAKLANELGQLSDELTPVTTDHSENVPVRHDSAELLRTLDRAYQLLKDHAADLPPAAKDTLEQLRTGTQRSEFWGRAGDMLRDTRTATENRFDPSEYPDSASLRGGLANYTGHARNALDVYERWGVDPGKAHDSLGELDAAVGRGDAVATTRAAHGLYRDPGDTKDPAHPLSPILDAAINESGSGATHQDVLDLMPSALRAQVDRIGRVGYYEQTLQTTQAAAAMTVQRVAREAAGVGQPRERMPPDASVRQFVAGYPDEHAAFEARRAMLTGLQRDPGSLATAMGSSYGDLAQTHPDVYQALVQHAGTAAAVLTQAMPPSIQTSLQHPGGAPPAEDDIRSFARVYTAVVEPHVFIGELASGHAWPAQGQAFAQVYPQQWSALGKGALEAATARGPDLTPQQATYLDLVFGVGNNIGGMWGDAGAESLAAANAAAVQKTQQAAQNLGKPAPAGTAPASANLALSQGPTNTPVT